MKLKMKPYYCIRLLNFIFPEQHSCREIRFSFECPSRWRCSPIFKMSNTECAFVLSHKKKLWVANKAMGLKTFLRRMVHFEEDGEYLSTFSVYEINCNSSFIHYRKRWIRMWNINTNLSHFWLSFSKWLWDFFFFIHYPIYILHIIPYIYCMVIIYWTLNLQLGLQVIQADTRDGFT